MRDKASTHHRTDALGVFTLCWAQVMVPQVVKLALTLRARSPGAADFWLFWQALSCFLAIVFYRRAWATLHLMCASLVVLWRTGSQSNHVFLEMAVCFAVLLTFSQRREVWTEQVTHSVRCFVTALYLVTALHKLNSDWSNPQYSCCTLMLGGVLALPPLRWALPLVPWHVAPHAATATELILPLMIAARFDRLAAMLGCFFHLVLCQMLSPMSVYPFSILMAPLYICIIPERAVALFELARPWVWMMLPIYACLSSAWTKLMAADLQEGEELFEYPPYGMWAPGVVWCLMVHGMLIIAALRPLQPPVPGRAHSTVTNGNWRGKLPALGVVAMGLSPYFGVRDYPALAMFSNLRTAGGSNHLFLADDFDFIGWQRDYVTIHETSIPALQLAQVDLGPLFTRSTKKVLQNANIDSEFWITPPLAAWPYPPSRDFVSYSMPYVELRRRLAPLRNSSSTGYVRYTRTLARARLNMPWLWQVLGISNDARDRVIANITYDVSEGGDPELELALPHWQSLLFRFRTFDVDYSPCRH